MFLARKRLAALEERIQTAEGHIERLERDRAQHLSELDEMYEKMGRLYGRIQKRQQRAIREEDLPEPSEVPCPDPITDKVLKLREARAHVLGQSAG